MRATLVVAALFLTPAALCTGCGSDEASSDQGAVGDSLLRVQDLPAGTKVRGGLPGNPCAPAEVLGEGQAQFAQSPLFSLRDLDVQEAVGIFTEPDSAKNAYTALAAESRLDCIRTVIEQRGDISVKVFPPRSLDAGEEAESILFQIRRLDSGRQASAEVTSIRSGNAVASLIFLSETAKPAERVAAEVVDAAAARLSKGID